MNKKCSVCLVVKPLDEFLKDKTKPDGHRADCKECRNKKRRKNYDPEKNRLHSKKWYENSGRAEEAEKRRTQQEKIKKEKELSGRLEEMFLEMMKAKFHPLVKLLQQEIRKRKNRERQKRYAKEGRLAEWQRERRKNLTEEQLEIERKKSREANQRNRDQITSHMRKKRKTNPVYKIEIACRNRVRQAIKRQNIDKQTKTIELIGCSFGFLKKHIESQFQPGMTWENHGHFGWHIDHKIPCASFDLSDPEQQKKCFHYTNLQPLWWDKNLSKGAKCI